ncbi:MAG: hypothetical protein GY768_25870 [Planctomycetaceae bacterium]|nr:hypothetical protein [Planctomycetaceae bacterium]
MFKRKSKSAKPAKAAKPKKEKKSRKKKEKPAKRAAAASAVALKKHPTDIYTVMLIISFVAVLIASILLVVELGTYGDYPWWKAN